MKLSRLALLTINGMAREDKEKLAKSIGVSAPTLYRYLRDNDDSLTKAAAVKIIKEETGLFDEQILEEDEVKNGVDTKVA